MVITNNSYIHDDVAQHHFNGDRVAAWEYLRWALDKAISDLNDDFEHRSCGENHRRCGDK